MSILTKSTASVSECAASTAPRVPAEIVKMAKPTMTPNDPSGVNGTEKPTGPVVWPVCRDYSLS